MLELLFSFLIVGSNLLAAALIYRMMFNVKHQREIYVKLTQQRQRFQEWGKFTALEQQLKEAGSPFNITARRYQWTRYSIFIVWSALVTQYMYTHTLAWSQILTQIALPLFFLNTITGTKRKSLFTYTLSRFKVVYITRKNQEVFMLYSMIIDELREAMTHAKNLYTLLNELKSYTHYIQPSLIKGLRDFKMGAVHGMKSIGEHIGTEEAKEVCTLIADLENANYEEIRETIASREELFQNRLRENMLSRRKAFGNLIYGIVLFPLGIYMYNSLHVLMTFLQNVLDATNQW